MTVDLDTLERLAKAAPTGEWETWTSNSWRRVYAGGDPAITPCVQHYDNHPDLTFAPGVREWIEAATPDAISELIAEVRVLREANQNLHRRAQQIEAPRDQYKALLRQANDHWGKTWMHEFDRLLEAHKEIQAMFRELTRVYEYPQDGRCMHSCMDMNVEFPHEKHSGIWANCFLTRQGGMKSIRVLDEVRRAVNELICARAKKSK